VKNEKEEQVKVDSMRPDPEAPARPITAKSLPWPKLGSAHAGIPHCVKNRVAEIAPHGSGRPEGATESS